MTFGEWLWWVVIFAGIYVTIRPSADNFRRWTAFLIVRILVWALTGV